MFCLLYKELFFSCLFNLKNILSSIIRRKKQYNFGNLSIPKIPKSVWFENIKKSSIQRNVYDCKSHISCSIYSQLTHACKIIREVLFVVRASNDIIKPDSAQNKRTTFSTKTRIAIKLEKLEKCPETSAFENTTLYRINWKKRYFAAISPNIPSFLQLENTLITQL